MDDVALARGQARAKTCEQIVCGSGSESLVAQQVTDGRPVAVAPDVRERLEQKAALDPDSAAADVRTLDRAAQGRAECVRNGRERVEPARFQHDDLIRPTRLSELELIPRRNDDHGVVRSDQRHCRTHDRPISREQQHVARKRADQLH